MKIKVIIIFLDLYAMRFIGLIIYKLVNKLCSADPESIWIYVQKEIDTNQDEKIDMTEFRDSISKQIKLA
jgi:hypothetical protein